MSHPPSHFRFIFDTALEAYKNKTGKDLTSHPLLAELTTCDSPNAILTVLRNQIPVFDRSNSRGDKLTKWLGPTVNVLYVFSAALGEGVGLVRLREYQCDSSNGTSQLIIYRRSHQGKWSLLELVSSFWCVFTIPLGRAILKYKYLRRLRTLPPARTHWLKYSNELRTSSDGSRHTSMSPRLRR
jgi:hypothetical protein